MNWLTWRQHRMQALAGYAALAVMGGFLVVHGLGMLNAYNASGLARCLVRLGDQECDFLSRGFTNRYSAMQYFLLFYLLVPALVGVFWGAPIVARELEHGTHRLAWTQGVTRRRWIGSKLAIVGGSALVLSTILSLIVTWWSQPLLKTNWSRFDPGVFDFLGLVPVAYTLFALALGAALGAAIRKTLPAIFATLAIFTAVRLTIILAARERYMAAKTAIFGFKVDAPVHQLGDWILSQETINVAGKVVPGFGGFDLGYLATQCPGLVVSGKFPAEDAVVACINTIGLRSVETFHPADRFWTFQAIEAGIFLVLTALLVVWIVRRVRRLS